MDSAGRILREVFGFSSFRGLQQAVIEHVLNGADGLVIMPTGGGKSLCYQLPALLLPGTTIVISPLIALMQDQVGTLLQMGIAAASLNSQLSLDQQRNVQARLRSGELKILYVSPERAVSEHFFELLTHLRPSLFAIDEAHCVSQWGHDFRPEYRKLPHLYQHLSGVPRLALTATADEQTRQDILRGLSLEKAKIFIAGFDRPNIRYQVLVKNNSSQQLISFLQQEHPNDAGIIYAQTRSRVEKISEQLSQRGWNSLPYHAGLDNKTRSLHQDRFLKEEGVIMVATVAFGMGIDKPNVRFVCHMDMPKSIEAYYQETGRAGRDGLPADAWMAYGLSDVIGLQQLMANSLQDANAQHRKIERRKLQAMLGYCEASGCRRALILSYFGDQAPPSCGSCDNCLNPPQTWDATVAAQKVLSCIYRTGQRYGTKYIIDVLLGKESEKVRQNAHHTLSTYGIGKDLSAKEWDSVLRQLVALDLIKVDVEGYGSLLLNSKSRSLLKGEHTLSLRRDLIAAPASKGRFAAASKSLSTVSRDLTSDFERKLFENLRKLRLELAKEQGVPPYVIFHDSTLYEMTRERPQNLAEMSQISGVGSRKLERYGLAFLGAILATCNNKGH